MRTQPPAGGPPAADEATPLAEGGRTSSLRRRLRRAPRAAVESLPEAAGAAEVPGTGAGEQSRALRRWWPSVTALVAVCALLAAVLVYVARQPQVASSSARSAAVGSAQSTLETLLSYDYKTYDAHVEQVKPQLTAPFLDQFSAVAGTDLKTLATTNQTVVQARVYNLGVMDTTTDTVRVLAFVNQATTTKAKPDPSIDQNRVIATMKQVDGRWLVSSLDAF